MLAMAVTVHAWSGSAFALDEGSRETVRTLANNAEQDFKKRDYDSALKGFERAYSLAKVPRLAVWIAQTHEQRGELVSAYEYSRQALNLTPNELWVADFQQRAQKEAEEALLAITPRLAKLTVRLEGSQNARVSVDNVALPSAALGLERLADPGTRHIVAERGTERAEETVVLAEGAQREVVLKLNANTASIAPTPVPPPPAPSQPATVTASAATQAVALPPTVDASTAQRKKALRTAGWVGVGVGAAGIGLGAVTGLAALSKYNSLKDKCQNDTCPPDKSSAADSYNSMRTVSTVGFIAGAVVAAAGVTLVITQLSEEPAPAVAVWVSPGMAGVRGKF